jgi:uroporphyrin-III C-methyltransferase/precorrin-2 dehydrogenase/sirohydrochlorin ferrochelatase/uroporphyrin-III C-methyltransferase
MQHKGFVSLVGAGPGDAELLTIKALRLLQRADVVVYDRLVSAEILDLIPAGISRIAVGKSPGKHCVPQHQINDILVSLARTGRHIVRLKGGDPYMFGRGGEEVLALRRHHISFEVVPGITAASACGAYCGIPLTHRGLSRGVHFITGHFSNDEPLDIDWAKVADPDSTLVIYMGLANLSLISASLIQAGLLASTPAAAIENGTTTRQRRVLSTLAQLDVDVTAAGVMAPAMIIIGNVVSLAHELDWFQQALESTSDFDEQNIAARH